MYGEGASLPLLSCFPFSPFSNNFHPLSHPHLFCQLSPPLFLSSPSLTISIFLPLPLICQLTPSLLPPPFSISLPLPLSINLPTISSLSTYPHFPPFFPPLICQPTPPFCLPTPSSTCPLPFLSTDPHFLLLSPHPFIFQLINLSFNLSICQPIFLSPHNFANCASCCVGTALLSLSQAWLKTHLQHHLGAAPGPERHLDATTNTTRPRETPGHHHHCWAWEGSQVPLPMPWLGRLPGITIDITGPGESPSHQQ